MEISDGTKFEKLKENPDYQKIVETLTDGKGEWKSNKKNPHKSIARGSLIEEAKVWFYFLDSTLMPTKHVNTVKQEETILLYAILKGYKISVGKLIEQSILKYLSSNFRGHLPHPAIITYLCISKGVKFNREKEERCPNTSPLTLIAIIKLRVNKGERKMKEIEEGRTDSEQTEQAIVVSTMKRRDERQ